MNAGERFIVVARNLYGRTGRLLREAPTTPTFWEVQLDGVRQPQWIRRECLFPESRGDDFDWQAERGLL